MWIIWLDWSWQKNSLDTGNEIGKIDKYMGCYTYTDAIATFDTEENARKALGGFVEWATGKNGLKDEDYSIYDITMKDNRLHYRVDGGRPENCQWQCENIRDYLKKVEGCTAVEQSLYVQDEAVCWYKGEDEEENNNLTPDENAVG